MMKFKNPLFAVALWVVGFMVNSSMMVVAKKVRLEDSRTESSSSLSLFSLPCDEKAIKFLEHGVGSIVSLGFWAHVIASWKNYPFILKHIWSLYKAMAIPYVVFSMVLPLTSCIMCQYEYEHNEDDIMLSSDTNSVAKDTLPDNGSDNSIDATPAPSTETWYGFHIPKKKFRAWLGYQLQVKQESNANPNCNHSTINEKAIRSRIHFFPKWKSSIRQAWLEGRLLTSRPLRPLFNFEVTDLVDHALGTFTSVLNDEFKDDINKDDGQSNDKLSQPSDYGELLEFLHTEYGSGNTTRIIAAEWNNSSKETQLEVSSVECK